MTAFWFSLILSHFFLKPTLKFSIHIDFLLMSLFQKLAKNGLLPFKNKFYWHPAKLNSFMYRLLLLLYFSTRAEELWQRLYGSKKPQNINYLVLCREIYCTAIPLARNALQPSFLMSTLSFSDCLKIITSSNSTSLIYVAIPILNYFHN
jgi:hypothetical protein